MNPIVRDFYFKFLSPNRYNSAIRNEGPSVMGNVGRFYEERLQDGELHSAADSACHVRWAFLPDAAEDFPDIEEVFANERHCLIVSEVHWNPGMSITNSWETLMTQMEEHFQIKPGKFQVIEHYGPFSYNDPAKDESFSRVKYHRANEPRNGNRYPLGGKYRVNGWAPMDGRDIAYILGVSSSDQIEWPFKNE